MLSLTSGTELARFRRGTLPKLAVVVMLTIPLLYGALYLWAFWNPTARLDALPVALVNADQGATRDGSPVRAGDELVAQLEKSDSLDWRTVDAKKASDGLRAGDYYFAVTIPAGFSADLVSAGGDDPRSAQLEVTYDDANSFIATTLGRSAMNEVRDAVAASAGREAVDRVLVGLGAARDGFAQAGDGAVRLRDGAAALDDGTAQLAAGAQSAHAGAQQLASGAADAAGGATTLRDGAASLANGAAGTSAGAHHLADGAATAAGSATSLRDGTAQVAAGAHDAVTQVGDVASSLGDLQGGLGKIGAYLSGQAAAGDQTAAALASALHDSAASLPSAAELASIQQRLGQLDQGAAATAAGASQLADGLGTLSSSARSLANGTDAVAQGADRVSSGAASLATGVATLHSGAEQLADATGRLASGARDAESGAAQLKDGSDALTSGLTDGASSIPADSAATRDARAAAISHPVDIASSDVAPAKSLGEGFAPLFLPLALFVGGIITWLLLRPLPTRALATPAAGWRVALAGYLPAALVGVGQVVVLTGVVALALGLSIGHPLGAVAFLVLVAAAFLALQQALVSLLGSAAGKVAMIALLMLQLTSASGTYPVETTPGFFRAIHPFLPMSYAVQGLRELITGTPGPRTWTAVAVLAAVLLASLAATSWKAARMRTWTVARLHPALTI
jgi:putative membrane protein